MLRNLVQGLCGNRSGLVLVAGLIGVLTGIERLLSAHPPSTARISFPPAPALQAAPPAQRFNIRRTQSEIGLTYWILETPGAVKTFDLFDTWQEAMDEAQRRSQLPANLPFT